MPYIEAVRQLQWELGDNNAIVIHLTLVPYLAAAGELKTKPTQHSVKALMESGLKADVLVCRTDRDLPDDLRQKLALFCNVKKEAVIQSIDVATIYDVPNLMLLEGLDTVVLKKLALSDAVAPDLTKWNNFLQRHKNPKHRVRIGLVGKYVELPDAYKSILEAFIHAGAENEVKVEVLMIHSEYLDETNLQDKLSGLDGVLVAPGFGERGIEGKIKAIQYVREHKIPFLGICLGMQMAVIEFARHVVGFENANTAEVNPNSLYKVIDLMQEQKHVTQKGGTMRLGAWDCELQAGSKIYEVYQQPLISERHRHRYEFNSEYRKPLEESGLRCSGINPKTGLVEVIELPSHPWFVGVQYHPEYKSTVAKPHPLFVAFVKAALEYKLKK